MLASTEFSHTCYPLPRVSCVLAKGLPPPPPTSQVAIYLGIEINSIEMQLSLPEGKLVKVKTQLDEICAQSKISRKKLESVAGSLSHCSTVVRGGSTFCRRIYDLCKVAITNKLRNVSLNEQVMGDFKWWRDFITVFNGKATIVRETYANDMITDSSAKGFGGHCGSDWFFGYWSGTPDWSSPCTHHSAAPGMDAVDVENELELWPVVVGLKR